MTSWTEPAPDERWRFARTRDEAGHTFIGIRTYRAADVDQTPWTWAGNSHAQNKERRDRTATDQQTEGWLGIEGGGKALLAAVRDGWPAGLESIRQLHMQPPQLGGRRRRLRVRAAGDQLRPEAVTGAAQPERAWLAPVRVDAQSGRRLVVIACNTSSGAGTRGRDLLWRGAAALAATEALVLAGHHVHLIGYAGARSDGHGTILHTVDLKQPTEPVDAEHLAAFLCLSGWKRTALHAQRWRTWPACPSHLGMSGTDPRPEHWAALGYDPADVFPMPYHVLSRTAAEDWLASLAGWLNPAAQVTL